MKPSLAESGSVSLAALVALLLFAALAAGGALLINGLTSYEQRSTDRQSSRALLEAAAREIVSRLVADSTPRSDSPLDDVWGTIGGVREDGIAVSLSDLSSLLNPNWIQKNLLTNTAIGGLLAPEASADELQQRREDQGLSTEIGLAYGDLFREEALQQYLSGFSWANINTTDEFVLRKLYLLRTEDGAGAERFHARIQELLGARRLVTREELRAFLAEAYSAMYPVVNAEPAMNTHFVPVLLLRELLSYPEWGVPRPGVALQSLLQRREEVELTEEDLRQIIGAPASSRIYQYLGVQTWFWRVAAQRGAERLEMVVARLPSENDEGPRFVVVEERYVP